jgi:EAL domain-containing protein (putative c-di-GMP-specific phosphodiesterase class I)
VESTKAWRLLAGLRCDEAQGYLIARPLPQEQFAAWVRSWVPPHVQDEPLGTQFSALL